LVATPGCLHIKDADGTTHHIIVGVGVVSVKEAPNRAMTVTSANVVGLYVTDQPGASACLGYSSNLVTTVADGAENIVAEVRRDPFAPLRVETPNAGWWGGDPDVPAALSGEGSPQLVRADVVELGAASVVAASGLPMEVRHTSEKEGENHGHGE
jgi:hypothetical protein